MTPTQKRLNELGFTCNLPPGTTWDDVEANEEVKADLLSAAEKLTKYRPQGGSS